MSRSYRKPILKQVNCVYAKKLFRKKNRHKLKDLDYVLQKGDFKKTNCTYDICDWNFGEIKPNDELIRKFYRIRGK